MSSRSRPSSKACAGERLVEASTRTSTSRSLEPPTRFRRLVSSTRNRRDCRSSGISVISSSSRVPPLARSNTPSRVRIAPVKLPRSCPNSSASISVAGIAAQLMATNGLSARGLMAWIDSATSSLPQPLSPQISTVESVGATRPIRSRTFCMAGELPISRNVQSSTRGAAA